MKRFSFKACSVLLCLAMMLTVIFIAPVSAEETTVIGYSDTLVGDAWRYGSVLKGSKKNINVDSLQDVKTYTGAWPKTENSFKITDVEGLVMLSNIVNSGKDSTHGFNFYLANDIDFAAPENVEWAKKFVPIGYKNEALTVDGVTYAAEMPFFGTLDGRGHTIKNMHLSFEDNTVVTAECCGKTNMFKVTQVALIGYASANYQASNAWPGEIRNVVMQDCSVNTNATTSGKGNAGWGSHAILVGRADYRWKAASGVATAEMIIRNCAVLGNSSVAVNANAQAAGIGGRGEMKIYNCTNYANVATNNRQGGINGWGAQEIAFCVNYGIIGRNGMVAGSIAGEVPATTPITNCQNYGYAHKNGKLVALVGKGGVVTDCYEAGLKRMLEKTKFQINEDGTGVRMLAGLDSLNYESVTFMVTYNDQTVELTTKSAYSSVAGTDAEGNPITYAPNVVGDTAAAKYIAAYDLLNVPAGATFTFVVKVVTTDGITLTSTFAKTVEVPAAQ